MVGGLYSGNLKNEGNTAHPGRLVEPRFKVSLINNQFPGWGMQDTLVMEERNSIKIIQTKPDKFSILLLN